MIQLKEHNIDKQTPSPLLERNLERITTGLPALFKLLQTIPKDNASEIAGYILAMKTETNMSDHYRRDNIVVLIRFSKSTNNKPFKDVKRDDIVAFLDSFRKPETLDPLHKWIGTYNLFRIYLMRFFKWLYSPDVDANKRRKPEVIQNIPKLRRKEHSIYKPTDLWTLDDHLLFLRYCASKRIKCYHAVDMETACRPEEILKLKIKDIVFKTTGTKQYAQVFVNGKTGTRPLPLIDSIPYVKDYITNEHPQPSNPEAIFISSTGKNLGRMLHVVALHKIYDDLKKKFFPRLLQSQEIPHEDKQKLRELLKKPWNPYILRHSALTKMSGTLTEADLRVYAGWTANSEMPLRYVHKWGNEACEAILEARGIVSKDQQTSNPLRSKQCPHCNEPNKPDSKLCIKCRMILTYDAYNETLQDQKEKEDRLSALENQIKSLVIKLGNMEGQGKNEFAKHLFESGLYQKEQVKKLP